jgi:hypothetical protein
MLAGQGDPSGSRDGWRADQEGSAGGSSNDQGETGALAGCEFAGAACGSHADGDSSSGATAVAHPAQYRGDPPSGFPQFGQNRMGAPWLHQTFCG